MNREIYDPLTAGKIAAIKKDAQLYRKVGKRYVTATDPWAYNDLQDGAYLVIVRPGSTTIRQRIWPASHETAAAIELYRAEVEHAMFKEGMPKIPPGLLAKPKVAKAWKRFVQALESTESPRTCSCISDVVQAGIDALKGKLVAGKYFGDDY